MEGDSLSSFTNYKYETVTTLLQIFATHSYMGYFVVSSPEV